MSNSSSGGTASTTYFANPALMAQLQLMDSHLSWGPLRNALWQKSLGNWHLCHERPDIAFMLRMQVTQRIVRNLAVVAVIAAIGSACQGSTGTPADAAISKLRALAGEWQGQDAEGNQVKSSFVPIASDTAVMETLTMPQEKDDMVTLYSLDGDSILLMHYCPTNNQPRMRAVPSGMLIKELVFSFQGAGNLPDLSVGHEHKLVLRFDDPDHITERWTWRNKGKDTEMVFHLTRTHAARKQ